mmetsp:Transcript_29565/g.53630  ORF Transcript_29565/g.53630 Transcript_29565/m.53630 type:complete len:148 (-) Transcript_29565:1542-1985(-)|eukprot:CAMPEP_0201973138 /NCGR_PEP_ID=MMETSP0904-20121228/44941_1 /ASSEMBLY_ACC=CAM_ASM_000553 /TAXON_ID=420261 /ORGANISM="Thalassiosira antarctica, Strain CCMP982" /LENGTH=147 /DNA_ID=CAMNT_0048523205 /DNA_START=274 /DNA_END=717 /DNA_ORIENTATION=+
MPSSTKNETMKAISYTPRRGFCPTHSSLAGYAEVDSCASSADSDRYVGESSPSPSTLFFIERGIQSSITRMHYERMRHSATVMERPTKPSSPNSPTGGSPTPPSFDGPIEDESFSEGFEDGDLRMTVFDTDYYDLPWTIDDTFSFTG